MPLYSYRCQSCGTAFDQLRSIAAADQAAECPTCHRTQEVRRAITVAARVGRGGAELVSPVAAGAGGCCGGGCGCGR